MQSFCFLLAFLSLATLTAQARVTTNVDHPQYHFALQELEAVRPRGEIVVTEDPANSELQSEGFAIRRKGARTLVQSKDPGGTLYGILELAEQIALYGEDGVRETVQNPYQKMRGTKFNIPLDVRTPSYSDMSDAGQRNIAHMWDFDFWQRYLDELAKSRYNFVSLWSLHPFPSLVKVPGYEEIALDDVKVSAGELKEHYALQGWDFDAPEVMDTLTTVRQITIEEKIAFWRRVMRYGKERNIAFYFITWNVFTYGTEGKYGITDDLDNPVTRDYFRKSVTALIQTYPDLAGIGLTTGENMPRASFDEKEDWAYDTYARGVLDAVTEDPAREITFVHRQHQTGALTIADKFQPLIDHPRVNFIYSFKYAKAHVYGATRQPYPEGFLRDIADRPELRTIWTLRNDDIYYFRWAAPDYVKEFIRNIPYERSDGYYYGSDQYVWGMNFLDKYPLPENQLDVEKHWLHWKIWGRVGYDPEIPTQRFSDLARRRLNGLDLFDAWQHASMVYPIVTGFHWGDLDFKWYPEANQARPSRNRNPTGFHDINWFITLRPHVYSGYNAIPDFVAGKHPEKKSPYAVAAELKDHAEAALAGITDLPEPTELEQVKTIEDIRTLAYLGLHFAHKIEAAAALAEFRATGALEKREVAITALQTGITNWQRYAANASAWHHNPFWTNRVGYVDWNTALSWAYYDLELIGAEPRIPSAPPLTAGKIFAAGEIAKGPQVEYRVDEAGYYVVAVRYTTRNGGGSTARISVNDGEAVPFPFWYTGSRENHQVAEKTVYLETGINEIQLRGAGFARIDQLSVRPHQYGKVLAAWRLKAE